MPCWAARSVGAWLNQGPELSARVCLRLCLRMADFVPELIAIVTIPRTLHLLPFALPSPTSYSEQNPIR